MVVSLLVVVSSAFEQHNARIFEIFALESIRQVDDKNVEVIIFG
jgi:hypothetical protein